jgi:putative spermidine/putrescine transport system substrate-binding protein
MCKQYKSIKKALQKRWRMAGLTLCGLLFGVSVSHADIRFASWGGAYTASQQKAYIDTWKKGSGVTVEKYNGGLVEIKEQVESGNVTWDVVDVVPDQAITGCKDGLFVKVDQSEFINDLVVPPVSECVVPQIVWAYNAFYDKGHKVFKDVKPETIKDFFDVEKFPGKRGIHTWPNALIEMALVADGVKPKDVYDVMSTKNGIDRAFAKLDSIRDHVVFWSAGAKPLDLVSSGEVVMSLAYNGRIGAAILSEGKNFGYIWDGAVLEQEYLVALAGGKNEAEAKNFLAHASSAESLANLAKYITYAPMRESSIDIIKKGEPWFEKEGGNVDIMPHLPTNPKVLKRAVIAEPFWWADNGRVIQQKFDAWKGTIPKPK